MPNLKTHRGTVLYAELAYRDSMSNNFTKAVNVFDLNIGGVQSFRFLLNDNSPAAFDSIFADMTGIFADMTGMVVDGVRITISYPDGSFSIPSFMDMNQIELVAWSEQQLLAVNPVVDPDWRLNGTFVTVSATHVKSLRK